MKIVCTCQEDFNVIPDGFCGEIEIRFGKLGSPAVVDWRFYSAVIKAHDNVLIYAFDNAVIEAYDDAVIEAHDNAKIKAYDNVVIDAYNNAVIEAHDNAKIKAYDNAKINAYDDAAIEAHNNAVIMAYDNAAIDACDDVVIEAYDNTKIKAYDDVVVNSYGVTKVITYDEVLIEAHDQSVVLSFSDNEAICNDLAVAYKWPISNTQYLDFFACKTTNHGTAILYKAAHKLGDVYYSHHDHDFTYKIGDVITPQNGFSTNIRRTCAPGIHCAPLEWAKNFSCIWKNRAILEVEVPVSGIIVPDETDGKCRVPWAKVLREVEA